jgi:hypothetical protein
MGTVAAALFTVAALQAGNVAPANAGHHHTPAPPLPPVQVIPPVNVRDFGAVGDGATDDSTSIQNAANAALANNRSLFFPPGAYLHNSTLTFNGIVVTGSGASCVLQAGDPKNTAVILTGANVSIQNIVLSSSGLTGSSNGLQPNTATVLVKTATQFTVANDTIVQGPGRFGVFLQRSSVGNVSAIAFDGTGTSGDDGVVIDGCFNVSVVGNLFQNEDQGVVLFPFSGLLSGFGSQFISIMGNSFGNVTYPMLRAAVNDFQSNTLSVVQNVVQMANSSNGTAGVSLNNDVNVFVTGNQIWGGYNGVVSSTTLQASGPNTVTGNFIRNAGSAGLALSALLAKNATQFVGNQLGECGLQDTSLNAAAVSALGSATNMAAVQIMNNSYQGHQNLLLNYIYAPNVPGMNVSGNTQGPNVIGLPIVTGP